MYRGYSTVRPAGIPSSAHVSIRSIRILFSAWFAFTVLTTALDSDERLHSDVGLKQEREKDKATYVREKTLRSGERLQQRASVS